MKKRHNLFFLDKAKVDEVASVLKQYDMYPIVQSISRPSFFSYLLSFYCPDDLLTSLVESGEISLEDDTICGGKKYRGISILLPNTRSEDIAKLEEFCKSNDIRFFHRYSKDNGQNYIYDVSPDNLPNKEYPLYYFWICGDTNDFNELNKHMDNRLVLTDYAEIGNIADKGEDFMEDLVYIVEESRKMLNQTQRFNEQFCSFACGIDDVNVLKEFLDMYSGSFSVEQRKILQGRVDVLSGNSYVFKEDALEYLKSKECDILALRKSVNMSRKDFAAYFGIPYRTIEDWENKKSNCSSYLYNLMLYRIKNEFLRIH